MEYVIELFVRLKTKDTVALTAKDTLERDMGYLGRIEGVDREDYWAVYVDVASRKEAERLSEEFATGTKLFVNPNKHSYRALVREKAGEAAAAVANKAVAGAGSVRVGVLVRYRDDEKAELTRETLRSTLGYGDTVKSLDRGTLWVLLLRAGDRAEAETLAEEIALTKGIKQGLLVNPHSQVYEILPA